AVKDFIGTIVMASVIAGGFYMQKQDRQESQELHERFATSMVARHDGLIWNTQMAMTCDLEFDGRSGEEGIRRYLACEERMLDPEALNKALALDRQLRSCGGIENPERMTECFAAVIGLSVVKSKVSETESVQWSQAFSPAAPVVAHPLSQVLEK
ncbi:hypothetical protein V2S84_19650, partial [Azotobacter chroococcum]|nr:hypothetical protein [Azotobacter chroococcum]